MNHTAAAMAKSQPFRRLVLFSLRVLWYISYDCSTKLLPLGKLHPTPPKPSARVERLSMLVSISPSSAIAEISGTRIGRCLVFLWPASRCRAYETHEIL